MYAIAGVSGHTGSVVASTLLGQGKPVRVIVRDAAKGEPWRERGAEVAVASLDDAAALTRALAGLQGAYVLLPPNPSAADPIAHNARVTAALATAIRAASVPHVVLLSSIGAQHADGTGPIKTLYTAERELAATGTALTAVRAAYFQENWGASLGTLASGTIYSFLPADAAHPMVATTDIGRAAASALVEGPARTGTQVIELAGPADYRSTDIAAALSTITGEPVQVQTAPLDGVVPAFTGFGLSTALAELYREMYAGMIAGRVAWAGGDVRTLRGSVGIEDTLRALLAR